MGFIDSMRQKGAGDGTSSEGPEAAAPPNGDGKKRVKRRKPEEMLASVVRESTVNAVIDLLKQNEPFVLPGRNSWVALALPVDYIGGLNKKQQKDEAKGSLIELINHDHIQAITTRYFLDEEVLGIIPTSQTLGRMEEYSLLTNATYHWMVLSPSQDGQELVVSPVSDKAANYSDAVAIANGSRSLGDYLPHVVAWTQAIDAPTAPANTTYTAQPDPPAHASAMNPSYGPSHGSGNGAPTTADRSEPPAGALPPEADEGTGQNEPHDDGSADSEDSPVFGGETDEAPELPVSEDAGDDGLSGYEYEYDGEYGEDEEDGGEEEETATWEQYAEHNRDREFTEEQVRATIARRFLSRDLDLEVALDEFEATFDTRAPAVRLELGDSSTEKPTDWLGEQVSLLAEQANSELEKLHRNHRKELRGLFVETMSLHAESVMRAVDEKREGSVYQTLVAAADNEYGELKAKAPEEVSLQRAAITQRYEQDADNRAEIAAAQAKQAFWDRARPEFERKIADVAIEVERRNEERHTHQRQMVLEMRRKDAHKRMQLGTTRAFQLLSEREAVQRQAEMDLLKQWNAKLARHIDDNRKHDIARAEALAVQLQQDTSIEKMKAAHAQRERDLKTEHEAQMHRLQAELGRITSDLERNREQAEVRMREREGEWQHKAEINNQMYTDLVEKTRDMTDRMHQEYQGQLMALNRTSHASIEELNRANQVQRRANKILFVLMAVFSLAAIGVGIILGWWIGYNTFSTSAMALPVWSY